MSLLLVIHNDGSGADDAANYNVTVFVNRTPIDVVRVEGHNRKDHWTTLVQRVVNVARGES